MKGTFTSIPLESSCVQDVRSFAREVPRRRGCGASLAPPRRSGIFLSATRRRVQQQTFLSPELYCKHRHRTNLHPAPQTRGSNLRSVAADRRDSESFRPTVTPSKPSAPRGVRTSDATRQLFCDNADAGRPVEGLFQMN